MVYFLITTCFYTIFTSTGIHGYSDSEKVAAVFMGLIIISLDLYFLFYEVEGIKRDRMIYLTDPYNYVDLVTAAINMWLVFETLTEAES